jgi:hypothetical protein
MTAFTGGILKMQTVQNVPEVQTVQSIREGDLQIFATN